MNSKLNNDNVVPIFMINNFNFNYNIMRVLEILTDILMDIKVYKCKYLKHVDYYQRR